MTKKAIIGLLAALIIIQFIKPDRNLSDDQTYNISSKYPVPENLNHILEVACNDCHSNKTRYPWYSNIQPIAWWLEHHVTDGKRHLNFSEFTRGRIAIQNHKLEEVIEMVEELEMPLPSYTYLGLHKEANLTEEQRKIIIDWAREQMETLKANYPADSLVMPQRR